MAPTHTYLSILNDVKVKFDVGKTEIILENETQEDGKKTTNDGSQIGHINVENLPSNDGSEKRLLIQRQQLKSRL